jgi:hypothetical protein
MRRAAGLTPVNADRERMVPAGAGRPPGRAAGRTALACATLNVRSQWQLFAGIGLDEDIPEIRGQPARPADLGP